MKTRRKAALSQFAICVENAEYSASLEVHKIYRVLPDDDAAEDGDVRIIDESGEDYLYPAEYFVVIEVSRQTARTLVKSFTRSERHAA
jgi:hypothetical protein